MLQKGIGEQPIKYKEEVQKVYRDARWFVMNIGGKSQGAIMSNSKGGRLSECFSVAWKAWEDAYYSIQNKK